MRALTLTAAVTAAAGLLLTGCGVLGGDDAADSDAGAGKSMEEAMLDFAACMRDNGVDMPDPEPDGGMIALPAMGEDDEFEAAMEACEGLLPVDENAPSDEERFETDLRMAQCLRENGIDVEDPEPGMGIALPVDPEDDEHMAALTRCSDEAGLGLELGDDTEEGS
ncbi:hypothetical protein [Nocardiopsis metallicus]|uniref:Secreted protein n=1 Tax=Nocardiopsis metallicus TaxID=179819 RepID=A0A840WPT0_9ACTN|nr:hypothetical protein [Nocardiopsis metallicus]MBB5493726.1 hypothetical protein [Nocardiopsis metallicus]